MGEDGRLLGRVARVQLQPQGLIIETPGQTPNGYFYDPSRLVQVERLLITDLGIEATTPTGEQLLDIHHINHPDKEYDDDDLICIGFTSHYDAMRAYFGAHMVDGIGGENIIVECDQEIWSENLGKQIVIENTQTGRQLKLELVEPTTPCPEFGQFAMGDAYEKFPATKMKATLQFLARGRRGFLFVPQAGEESVTVQPGDKVFAVD